MKAGSQLPPLSRLIDVSALRQAIPSGAELALSHLSGATIDHSEAANQVRSAAQDAQERWAAATRQVPPNISRRWLRTSLSAAMRSGGLLELDATQLDWILDVQVKKAQKVIIAGGFQSTPTSAATATAPDLMSRPGWMGHWEESRRIVGSADFNILKALGLSGRSEEFKIPAPGPRPSLAPWDAPEWLPQIEVRGATPEHNGRLLALAFELALYGPALAHEAARHLHWGRRHAGLMDPALHTLHSRSSLIWYGGPRQDWTVLLPSPGQELLGGIWSSGDIGADWLSQSLQRTTYPPDPPQTDLSRLSSLSGFANLGMTFRTRAAQPRCVTLQVSERQGLGEKPPRARLGTGHLGWSGPARSGMTVHVHWGGAHTTLRQLRAALGRLRSAELSDDAARVCLALQVAPEQCAPELRPAQALAREAGRNRITWPV